MRRVNPLSVYVFSAACGTFVASAASAQESAPPSSAEDSSMEEVVVTGSRIRQSEQGFANPVTSFTAEDIVQSGKTDLADYLAQSPALLGSTTGDLTAGSYPGFGEVGLNLLN